MQTLQYPECSLDLTVDSLEVKLRAYSSSGLSISYEVDDTAIVALKNDSTLVIKELGKTSVTAYQKGNKNYLSAEPVTREIIIGLISGIDENVPHDTRLIYPNPAKNSFSYYGDAKILKVVVMDTSNKQVRSFSPNSHNTYDLGGLQKCIYFVRVYIKDEEPETYKIVYNN